MKKPQEILPYFPRGNGPLVSILLPTRGRIRGLITAVDSLYSLAENKSNLEFIFKADDDDKETINAVNRISSLIPNCKVIVSPRGRGYLDLHIWINQMCSMSSGDWLFLMNDDARMLTQDWDGILKKSAPSRVWPGMTEICLFTFCEENMPNSMAFFLLRRQTYELLGHFSLSPLCDSWLWRVMACCGCHGHLSKIYLDHCRINDQLSKEVSEPSKLAYRSTFTYEQIKLRMEDVTKITNRIGWFESKRKWTTSFPRKEEWMLWKKYDNDIPIYVYFIEKENSVQIYGEEGPIGIKKLNEMNGLWAMKD